MRKRRLLKDPYNIVITGVGGQGNVMASRVLSRMLIRQGYSITIGETFGASQRGGSVMSHIRVSRKMTWSPQVPKGRADFVAALEPIEAIRILTTYGNEEVRVLANTRPAYPGGVIAGELDYPSLEEIKITVKKLSSASWFIDATEAAVKLGNPIFGNIIMIGAMSHVCELPIDRKDFEKVISETFPAGKVDLNLIAFDLGSTLVNP
jgi:indolepyruvate ferredoxin oxidoreductase beta subunit